MIDDRRITFVARGAETPQRDWDGTRSSASRLLFLETYAVLQYALVTGVRDMELDIERVIVDRCASASQFLELLASLPRGFHGEVLLVRPNDSALLSAVARRGERVLHSLSPCDVRYYFEINGLVTGRSIIQKTA